EEWSFYDHTNSILPFESSQNNMFSIDDQNRVWAGNWSGLFYFENGIWFNFFEQSPDFPVGSIVGVSSFAGDQIWVLVRTSLPSTETYLVSIKADNQFDSYLVPEEILLNFSANFIRESADSRVYLGTVRNGSLKFEAEDWSKIPAAQSPLLANEINQIYIDQSTVWMQTGQTNGNLIKSMFQINPNGDWTFYNSNNLPFHLSDFHHPTILTGNSTDGLWFHTGDSLLRFQDGQWTVPQLPDVLEDVEEINSFIHFEPNGQRWLLEKWQSHLFYESDQGWIPFFPEEHGAGGGNYTDYFNHPTTNDFWMASGNGISRYNGEDWLVIRPKDYGTSTNWVHNMVVTTEGVIWATALHSLLRIENEIVTVFNDESTPIHGLDIRSLALDADEHLWIGMNGALAEFDGVNWTIFDAGNSGVPNGRIESLQFDENQNLWIGSHMGGFAVYNPEGLPDHFLEDLHSTSISDLALKTPNCSLFPNPVGRGKDIRFDLPVGVEDTTVDCYSTSGQLMWTVDLSSNQQSIAPSKLASLSNGMYFLQISNQESIKVCPFMLNE
ncbi:MAG: T9SS type A sorting domain-containing protein, partial [Bacteroidota bacterium]